MTAVKRARKTLLRKHISKEGRLEHEVKTALGDRIEAVVASPHTHYWKTTKAQVKGTSLQTSLTCCGCS